MKDAHETGTPIMRPLFYDFPGDEEAWKQDTAYMYGPDMLIAPVLEPGVTTRLTYLPKGCVWVEQSTGREFAGGQVVTAHAPIDIIPVFTKKEANIIIEELRA